jgi:hypothetical protein
MIPICYYFLSPPPPPPPPQKKKKKILFPFYLQSFQHFAMLAGPRVEVAINQEEGQVAD